MSQKDKIRLLIADNHEMLRCGVKALLAGTEIKVIAEAASGQTAVQCARNTTWMSCSWTSACRTATA